MKVHLIAKNQDEIDLFFDLLSKDIVIAPTDFEQKEERHFLFNMNFKKLQKTVTNKRKKVTLKQDVSVNSKLVARIGLYRSNGMSFQAIADKMNAEGFKNSRKNKFNRMQVLRLHKQYEGETKKLLKKKK